MVCLKKTKPVFRTIMTICIALLQCKKSHSYYWRKQGCIKLIKSDSGKIMLQMISNLNSFFWTLYSSKYTKKLTFYKKISTQNI